MTGGKLVNHKYTLPYQMLGGGLLQLVAYGAQDVYLTGYNVTPKQMHKEIYKTVIVLPNELISMIITFTFDDP